MLTANERAQTSNDGVGVDVEITPPAEEGQPLKLRIRAAVSAKKARRILIKMGGFDVELVQPKISMIQGLQSVNITDLIIKQARVPGTDEVIFDEMDAEWINELPMDEEWRNAIDQMVKLMGVNVERAIKNSDKTPDGTTS
jgi:hypothetical protein